jgi:hypothetical protein
MPLAFGAEVLCFAQELLGVADAMIEAGFWSDKSTGHG